MPKDDLFEIWIRKGDTGGPFVFANPDTQANMGEVLAIAKKLVDDGECDEAVVLVKRVFKKFRKYPGEG